MTGFRARFLALRASAFAVAALSQLQGQVSGPLLTALASTPPSKPDGQHASNDQPNPVLRPFPLANRGFLSGSLLLSTLAPVPSLPTGQHSGDNQPNPAARPFATALRGYFGEPPLALVSNPAATGDIIGCRIASAAAHNGWVAEIDIAGLSTGGSYDFGLVPNNDPSAALLALAVTSFGYDATGAASTIQRTVYGTQYIRKASPNETSANETAGAGFVTVRVALSDFVYDSDTPISVTIGPGLYTQGGTPNNAASFFVTNNSTLAYPKVIGRWAWPAFETVTGDFLLEAVCFHRGVQNGKPVAAVVFEVTDGTHTVTQTVTDMTVSARSGDANTVLVYATTIPIASFDQGAVLTANFTAYPWVGDAGSVLDSDTGITPPDERLCPHKLLCDKAGTYGGGVAVIDSVNGHNSTANTWVAASQAAAETAYTSSTANSYTTLGNAVQAIKSYNNANLSRNNCGGGVCLLTGNHAWPGTSNGTDLGAMDTWLTITRLSTVARASAAINSGTTSTLRVQRVKLYDISITGSSVGTITGTIAENNVLWVHACAINCTGNPAIYSWKLTHATQNAITAQTGGWSSFGTDKCPPALVRGNTGPTTAAGLGILSDFYCLLGNYNLRPNPIQSGNNAASQQITDNAIFAFNTEYGVNDQLMAGMTGAITHGVALIQNVVEKVTGTNPLMLLWAESATSDATNVLLWHNTFAGERLNIGYNDSGSTAYYRTQFSQRNNVFDEWDNKDDVFPTANAARVGSWPVGYNVGSVGNHRRKTSSDTGNMYDSWFGEFAGLHSINNGTTAFVDDASNDNGGGGDASGNGDYHLTSSASGYGLVPSGGAVLPFDLEGTARLAGGGSAGAYEDTVVTAVFRAPLVTRWAARRQPIDLKTGTQNLLETTLAPAPVETYIFRAPLITKWAAKPYPVALRTWIPPNIRLNLIEDDVPLSCGWGNPPTGAPWPGTLRTITQNLIASTLGAPPTMPTGRHAGDHQPNPRGYAHPTILRTIAHGPIPPTVAARQILAYDWPNPRGYVFPVSLRTGLPSRNLPALIGDDQFFGLGGPHYDWPNPRGYAYPVALRTWAPRPFQPDFLAPAPIVPIDWPNPRGYEYPVTLRSLTLNLQESTLAGQGVTSAGGIDIELTVVTEKDIELTVTTALTIDLQVL